MFTKVLALLLTGPLESRPFGWVNIQKSRLYWKLLRSATGSKTLPAKKPLPLLHCTLRIGVYGTFVGLLNFPKTLFEGFPRQKANLLIFDVETYLGISAGWLQNLTTQYTVVEVEKVLYNTGTTTDPYYCDAVNKAVTSINNANLDLLLIVSYKPYTYDVIDRIDTPCVIQACTGSDVLHHEKVSFYLYAQPQAGYFIKDQHLYSSATQASVIPQLVYPNTFYYDRRGLDLDGSYPAWAERDPLLIFLGTLGKLTASPVLEIILNLLKEDSDLEFVFMGIGDSDLAKIQSSAKHAGVISRCHYLGYLSPKTDDQGNVIHPDWFKQVSYMKRARLYPDPFPLGGGAARFEAYLTGIPSVHMGVRFDLTHGLDRQGGLVELPALLVPSGTAYTRKDYITLCKRCLYDENFARNLTAEQLPVARKVCDAPSFILAAID
ncbi:MAG: hypothetical protein MUO64_03130 [Anaerolineales bacterium]|nr:hypothetical protein [Anaerolineales bacterium]